MVLRDYACDTCKMVFEVEERMAESKNGERCLDLCMGTLKQQISPVKGFMVPNLRWEAGMTPEEFARKGRG